MKKRKRELAKPGIYGTVENPVVVSERDLREIAETFIDVKRAPVSLNGHWPDPAKPRLGNVVSVEFDEASKTLRGEVEEQDALAAAVDEGFFPDVSIGGKRRASDGKMYLHHLAYLGEEPPAVKNLISDISKSLEGSAPEGPEAIAASDPDGEPIIFPSSSALRLVLSDSISAGLTGEKVKEVQMPTLEEVTQNLEAEKLKSAGLVQENEALKGKLGKISEKYPDEELALSDAADPRVRSLVAGLRNEKKAALIRAATGKVPKAKLALLEALGSDLAVGASLELSEGAGEKKRVSQLDVLTQVFESIPAPVEPGRLDLADPADEKPIDMRALMSRV